MRAEVAQRAAAFGMTLMAYTRTRGKFQPQGFQVQETETLDTLLSHADYIVLSLPLTPDTSGIISARELALMKPAAFLINVARGRHVITDDLVAALQAGHLAGAGLDVTDPEPLPPDSPLWRLPNVVLTPHVAGSIGNETRRMTEAMLDEIERYIAGEDLLHQVDLATWDRAA